VATSLAKEPGAEARVEYSKRLARYLSVAGVPDYHALIASAKGQVDWPRRFAFRACAMRSGGNSYFTRSSLRCRRRRPSHC
jgi:hypothetical protein